MDEFINERPGSDESCMVVAPIRGLGFPEALAYQNSGSVRARKPRRAPINALLPEISDQNRLCPISAPISALISAPISLDSRRRSHANAPQAPTSATAVDSLEGYAVLHESRVEKDRCK